MKKDRFKIDLAGVPYDLRSLNINREKEETKENNAELSHLI